MPQESIAADHSAGKTVKGVSSREVCRLLSEILGRNVTAKEAPPLPSGASVPTIVAAYEEDEHTLMSVCICDLAFASHAGAALLLTPKEAADESLRSGKCAAPLLEALAEIFNICRQWFQQSPCHIASPKLYASPDPLPEPVTKILKTPNHRLDLDVAIGGYGNGRLTILV